MAAKSALYCAPLNQVWPLKISAWRTKCALAAIAAQTAYEALGSPEGELNIAQLLYI